MEDKSQANGFVDSKNIANRPKQERAQHPAKKSTAQTKEKGAPPAKVARPTAAPYVSADVSLLQPAAQVTTGFHAGCGHEPKVAVLTFDKLSKSNREFYLKYGILKYGVRGYVRSSRPLGRRMPIGELPFERSQKRSNDSGPSRPMQKSRHSDA